MNEVISSNKNKHIKNIKALHIKKYRDLNNQFIIEGDKMLAEALSEDVNINLVVFSENAILKDDVHELKEKCILKSIDYILVEEKLINETSQTKTPQGIIAVINKNKHDLCKLLSKKNIKIAVLEEIRDPGNLGTIVRTADACKIDAVILSKGCVDLYNAKTIRSTMGSIFHLPVFYDIELDSLINELISKDIVTIATDPYGKTNIFELPNYNKYAVIIGNESRGISDEVKNIIDHRVQIPMPGKSESLNAGIAAALVMYEMAVRKNYI